MISKIVQIISEPLSCLTLVEPFQIATIDHSLDLEFWSNMHLILNLPFDTWRLYEQVAFEI